MGLGQGGRNHHWVNPEDRLLEVREPMNECVVVTEVVTVSTTTTVLQYEPDQSLVDQGRSDIFFNGMPDGPRVISHRSKSRKLLQTMSGSTLGRRFRLHFSRRSLGWFLALGLAFFVLVKFLTAPFLSYNSHYYHLDDLYMEDLPRRLHMANGVTSLNGQTGSAHIPMLVPRLVHQIYSSSSFPRVRTEKSLTNPLINHHVDMPDSIPSSIAFIGRAGAEQ